jgi:murein peptide amidase A
MSERSRVRPPAGTVRRVLLALTAAGVWGCAPAMRPVTPPAPVAAVAPPPPPLRQHQQQEGALLSVPAAPEEFPLGQSVRGQTISMTVLRAGPTAADDARDGVLVIGGVHGNEPTGVDVARALLAELTATPHLAGGRTVAVLVNANPDGYASGTRANANGVDVNRNFPAANFKRSWRRGGGREPASEPETRAVLAAIERVRPALIISIHAMDSGRQCNNYDGPAEAVARLMHRHNGYPATPTIGYPTPGSLGSYAGIDQQIPTITLELPRGLSGARAWTDNRAALLAAIRGDG